VGSVAVGQNASFTVSAYPSRKYPARIDRVAYGSTITENVVTYLTYLNVDNADLSLRPGMTATATITASQRHDVLLVPNSALRFTPNSGVAGNASTAAARQLWVLRDGVAVPVPVVPGISDGHLTEITGGELQAGIEVIT